MEKGIEAKKPVLLKEESLDHVSGGYLYFRPRYNVADKEVIEVIDDETGT